LGSACQAVGSGRQTRDLRPETRDLARQLHANRAAAVDLALTPNRTAEVLNQPFRERQTKPSALDQARLWALTPKELAEQLGVLLRREPNTVVDHVPGH